VLLHDSKASLCVGRLPVLLPVVDDCAASGCCCTYVSLSVFGASSYVDVYNATSNSWTRLPAGLGEARYDLAAASLPSGLVFFAGGRSSGEKRSG
jgi:hypothetical protein